MSSMRVALVGFDRRTAEGFEAAGINIVSHIYANPYEKDAVYPNQPELINFHHWKQYAFKTNAAPPEMKSIRNAFQGSCFQDFIRSTDRWDWSRELVYDWSDYNHLFSLAFDDACNWLLKYNPDVVIYSNVPHQGIAIVNYHTARALGKRTKVFIQSPFSGRSWLVDHWNDLGSFKSSIPGEDFEIDIAPPEAQPFYMNKVRSETNQIWRSMAHKLRARTIVSLGLTGVTNRARRRNFQRNMGRWQKAVEDVRYLKNAKRFFCDSPGNEPYVYFPLHLQPEMTTDILGGIYADQVLALESLRKMVPENTFIYVKENPKQTGRLRSEAFFERLAKLPNIKFLSRSVPSFDLTENSVAVATITGTVGWEALRMGKPVIVFGDTYWKKLPGAFKFDQNISWEPIQSFQFDEHALKRATQQISKHAHVGICDPAYAVMQKNFDPEDNAAELSHTLFTKGGIS
ncbi:MAG: hypothetical protein AAGA53_11170 [Pseudomonadota bacterium]